MERYVRSKRGKIHKQIRKGRTWLSAEACNLDQTTIVVVKDISGLRCKRCNYE